MAVLLTDIGHRLWRLNEIDWASTLLRLHDDQIALGFYDPTNMFCGIEGQRWKSIKEIEAACAEPDQPSAPQIFVVDARRLNWWQPLPLFTEAMVRGRKWQLAVWLIVDSDTFIPAIIRENAHSSPVRASHDEE